MKIKNKYCVGAMALLLGWFLCLLITNPVYAANASLYITPPTGTFLKNETFNVAIMENSGDESVNAVEIVLNYPTDKLSFVDITYSTAFSIPAEYINSNGTIRFSRATFSPVSGNQLIASLKFSVKTGGTANINFTNDSRILSSQNNEDVLNGNTKGGSYSLKNQSYDSGVAKNKNTKNNKNTDTSVSPSLSTTSSNVLKTEGYFASEHDFNESGHVDVFDLTLLLNYYNTTVQKYDVNGDGIVNSVDISILLRNYGK